MLVLFSNICNLEWSIRCNNKQS